MALAVPVTQKSTKWGQSENFDYAVSAMQGHHDTMEDAHAIVLNLDAATGTSFFGVYDGHGGPAVSKYCARHLHIELRRHKRFRDSLKMAVERTFLRMDEMMKDRRAGRELSGYGGNDNWKAYRKAMHKRLFLPFCQKYAYQGPQTDGCTACVVLIRGNQIIVGNAGDSRCVLSRNNQAIVLSTDFTPNLPAERRRIEGAGHVVTFGEAENVYRIDDGIAISRSLGDLLYKDNGDLAPLQQAVTAFPEVCTEDMTQDDQFLIIACGGIWDCMTSEQAIQFVRIYLNAGVKLPVICEALLGHCLAHPRGRDNMTVVLVQFKTPGAVKVGSCNLLPLFRNQAADGQAPQSTANQEPEASANLSAAVQLPQSAGDQAPQAAVGQAPQSTANREPEASANLSAAIQPPQSAGDQAPQAAVGQAPQSTANQEPEASANLSAAVQPPQSAGDQAPQAAAGHVPQATAAGQASLSLDDLCENLVGEILVRLPADDPVPLVQAASVCKKWRNIISASYFRRRFRELHHEVPFLGILCNISARGAECSYITTSSFIPSRVGFSGWQAVDSQHSKVLLYTHNPILSLKLWQPTTGVETDIPKLDHHPVSWSAALICDKSCTCYCPNGPFRIVLIGTNNGGIFASIFSSNDSVWSIPTFAPLPKTERLVTAPPAHIGESLFFLLRGSHVLRFNLSDREFSIISRPPNARFHGRPMLIHWESRSLGFACLDEDTVSVYTRDFSSSAWVTTRIIDLQNLMPATSLMTLPFLVGYAPERGILFVWTAISGLFYVDLQSDKASRTEIGRDQIHTVIPYMGYYIPGLFSVREKELSDGVNAMFQIALELSAEKLTSDSVDE